MEMKKQTKTFSWHVTKRIFFSIVLFIYAILAIANYESFMRPKSLETLPLEVNKANFIDLRPNTVIIQDFIAMESTWSGFSFYFDNPNHPASTGYVTVELYDQNDELLGYASAPANTLVHMKRHHFSIETTLEKGESYYYKIICQDLQNDIGVRIRTLNEEHKYLGQMSVNGKINPHPLDTKFKFYRFDLKIIIVTIILWLFILGIILLPEKFWNTLRENGKNDFLNRIFFSLSPLLSFWIMERFSNVPITSIMATPLYFTMNLIVYVTLLLLFYLITNRTKASAILLLLSTFILGCVSYYVNIFRGAPLYPSDFLSIGTALNVANNYQVTVTLMVLNNVLLLLAFLVPLCMLENKKGMPLKSRIGVLLTVLIGLGSIHYLFLDGTFLKENNIKVSSFKPRRGYKKYGFAMSFMIQIYYLIPDKPDDYSVKNAEEITENYQSDSADAGENITPNIICIMNETFSDLNYINEVETNKEVLPFINGMKENTIKGKLHMSIFGSNTANSEFEFLTGNSMAFLPGRTVVYEFFVRDAMPNLTYNLINLGYANNKAMHPYKRDGWNREYVYNCMGFSEFVDETMFHNQDTVRKFISDEAHFNEIIEEYEKTRETSSDPFYSFNVTMQNHGGYGKQTGVIDEPIQFVDPALNRNPMATQYLNLMHMSDQATEKLIEYFENVDEPTVIVMFGDHMATLNEKIYGRIYGKSVSSLNIEETSRMYTTPYFIWANYDIPEADGVEMSANYLSAYLLKTLNLPMTGYQKYLMDLYETLPVITQICHKDSKGSIWAREDETSPYRKLLNEYHTIQYNNVIDYKNRLESFFMLEGTTLPEITDSFLTHGTTAAEATTVTAPDTAK